MQPHESAVEVAQVYVVASLSCRGAPESIVGGVGEGDGEGDGVRVGVGVFEAVAASQTPKHESATKKAIKPRVPKTPIAFRATQR